MKITDKISLRTTSLRLAIESDQLGMSENFLIQRAKAFVPILIPLLVGGFRRAEELANAMNSRCYEGAKKRTQMRVMKLSWRDLVATVFVLLFFVTVFVVYGMKAKWGAITWLYF